MSGLDYDADTAERYGWINRALPDAEIRDFVDRLARRIASFPASGIATVKSIVNQMSPISSSVLNEDSARFWKEIQLPEVQERITWMLANGGPDERADGRRIRHEPRALSRKTLIETENLMACWNATNRKKS